MKKAIVTGANGFVGAALCKELSGHGVETIAVVRSTNSDITRIRNLPMLRIVYCDMAEIAKLEQFIEDRDVDIFYHLAWSGVSGNLRSDYNLQLANVRGMLDAVNAASALRCKRFLGAGTLAQKDVNAYVPLDGASPNAVSCYGIAKITAHYMSKVECNRLGIEHVWALIANVYGEGDRSTNFINFAIQTMLKGEAANFTHGEQMYDFVHISDTARGLYHIGAQGKVNCAYYIGSTEPCKLKEYITMIRDQIDPNIQLNFGAVPFHGVCHSPEVFDCEKLVKDTGYAPQVPFRQGIEKTIAWIRKEDGK